MPTDQQKKKPIYNGLKLFGAGAGAYGLSKALLSDKETNDLKAFTDAQNNWAAGQDPRQNVEQYANLGHKAISARPFNLEGAQVVRHLRNPTVINGVTTPMVNSGIDQLQDYGNSLRKLTWNPASGEHYQKFTNSSLEGYLQQNKEILSDKGYQADYKKLQDLTHHTWFGNPNDKTIGQAADQIGHFGIKDPQVRNRLKQSLTSLIKDTNSDNLSTFNPSNVDKSYLNKLQSEVNNLAKENHLDLNHATAGQKADLLHNLDSYIRAHDENLWKQKQYVDWTIGKGIPYAGDHYKGIINPLVNAHDALKYIGGGAALAGGGYALYNYIKNKLQERKQQQEAVAKPVAL